MKNREQRLRLILFLLLIGIWGALAYRIYTRYFKKKAIDRPLAVASAERFKPDSDPFYELVLNYPNPFEVGLAASAQPPRDTTGQGAKVQAAAPKPAPVPVQFPVLEYKGFVRLRSGRSVALVTLYNQTFNWAIGETRNELRLLQIFPDSIEIGLNGERKMYLKAKQ